MTAIASKIGYRCMFSKVRLMFTNSQDMPIKKSAFTFICEIENYLKEHSVTWSFTMPVACMWA